ncbi:MAG: hypothetical protein Q9227_007188 [Pyrenula ochraceoflavens]
MSPLGDRENFDALSQLPKLRKLALVYKIPSSKIAQQPMAIEDLLSELSSIPNLEHVPELQLFADSNTRPTLYRRGLQVAKFDRTLACLTSLRLDFNRVDQRLEFNNFLDISHYRDFSNLLNRFLDFTEKLRILVLNMPTPENWLTVFIDVLETKTWSHLQALTLNGEVGIHAGHLKRFLTRHEGSLRALHLSNCKLFLSRRSEDEPYFGWIEIFKMLGERLRLQECSLDGFFREKEERVWIDTSTSMDWLASPNVPLQPLIRYHEPPSELELEDLRIFPCTCRAWSSFMKDRSLYQMLINYILGASPDFPFPERHTMLDHFDPEQPRSAWKWGKWPCPRAAMFGDLSFIGRPALAKHFCVGIINGAGRGKDPDRDGWVPNSYH